MIGTLTEQTVELLQLMIRNKCVNDGSTASGQEVRNADVLEAFLGTAGYDVSVFEPAPGRRSLVARVEGIDRTAPSLCLLAHTDVVPANPDGWTRDPFGGELVADEVWGRGAIDMLNLTASMAVAFRHLARDGFRPRGDLVFAAVADEESGSTHGARWLADNAPDAIRADYVLTESGGFHGGRDGERTVSISVGEKGIGWRRLRVHGEPGHGSTPYRANNALITAAEVIRRLAAYRTAPQLHELWRRQLVALGLDDERTRSLSDPALIDGVLSKMTDVEMARYIHACTHTTISPNVIAGGSKTNVIPDVVDLDVDIRVLPGERAADVDRHLARALGDLASTVEVRAILDEEATISPTDTPLWQSLSRAVSKTFPDVGLTPQFSVGFTDARVLRRMGATAYGACLMSPTIKGHEVRRRFHGNDERIDVRSLALTTDFWIDVTADLLG